MPKRTYQPSKIRRVKSYGFRARMETHGGQNVIRRRRAKGRASLSVSDEIRASKRKRITRIR